MHAGGIVQEYQDERPTGGVTLVKEEERKGTVNEATCADG